MSQTPKKCGECKQKSVVLAVQKYDAALWHDGRSYPVSIPDLEVLACQNCKNIIIPDQSEERLENALRRAVGLLMPSEIKSYREALGLTQELMAHYMGIAKDTISRWETGAQIQQQGFDNYLRAFFRLPELRNFLRHGESSDRMPHTTTTVAHSGPVPTRNNCEYFVGIEVAGV